MTFYAGSDAGDAGDDAVRLLIAAHPDRRAHLHGAWWPRSTHAQRELAAMLPVAAGLLGTLLGITLNRDEWPGAPLICQPLMSKLPKVSWYGLTESHLAVLHRRGSSAVSLLVVPPATPDVLARQAMRAASTPENGVTVAQILNQIAETVAP